MVKLLSLPEVTDSVINLTESAMYDPLAQLVEHLTFNQGVRRSSLRRVTIESPLNQVSLGDFRFLHTSNDSLYVRYHMQNYHVWLRLLKENLNRNIAA